MKIDTITATHDADVGIIGGGLGGLIAGASLAKLGHRVFLVDKHYIPGGCATTFKRRDYVMEVGLHAMDGLDVEDMKKDAFDFLEVEKNIEFIPLPEFFRQFNKFQDRTVPNSMQGTIDLMGDEFPEDREAIARFFQVMVNLRGEVQRLPKEKWKFYALLPFFPILYPYTAKFSHLSVSQYLNKYIKNEPLRVLLCANLPYYHHDPDSMSLLYFAMGQGSYMQGGSYYIRGGSQRLSDYFASLIREHGGTVLLGKEATKINIEDGAAAGFTFVDAFNKDLPPETVAARDLIVNAPMPTVPGLLPQEEGDRLREEISDKMPSCSLMAIYMGFNRDLAEFGSESYSTFITDAPSETLAELKTNFVDDYSRRGFAFVDYSRIDSGLTLPGKSFASITTVALPEEFDGLSEEEYAAKKEEIAAIMFKRLDEFLPGCLEALDHYEVATPRTITDYTANPHGSVYGFAQTPRQAGMKRPSRVSSVPGLRFASAWAAPGGGQSGAMIGGYLAARELHDAKGPTRQRPPLQTADPRRVRLIDRRDVADGTFEMTFEKPVGFTPEPGQYAFLSVEPKCSFEADMPIRALTLLSHANEPHVRFAMRYSDSPFKRRCVEMEPGEVATIYGPTGDFLLPETDQPIAFIVGGVGITPVPPMLAALKAKGFPAPVTLLYSDRSPETMAYRAEFEAETNPNFTFHPVFTGREGRINATKISAAITDIPATRFYLVGSRNFLKDMDGELRKLGAQPENIRKDDFG